MSQGACVCMRTHALRSLRRQKRSACVQRRPKPRLEQTLPIAPAITMAAAALRMSSRAHVRACACAGAPTGCAGVCVSPLLRVHVLVCARHRALREPCHTHDPSLLSAHGISGAPLATCLISSMVTQRCRLIFGRTFIQCIMLRPSPTAIFLRTLPGARSVSSCAAAIDCAKAPSKPVSRRRAERSARAGIGTAGTRRPSLAQEPTGPRAWGLADRGGTRAPFRRHLYTPPCSPAPVRAVPTRPWGPRCLLHALPFSRVLSSAWSAQSSGARARARTHGGRTPVGVEMHARRPCSSGSRIPARVARSALLPLALTSAQPR
jgi:hypothetical protein